MSSKADNPELCNTQTHEAESHYYRALDLIAEGDEPGAIAAYQKALEVDPTFTDAMHGLVRALQDADRLDDAIRVAKRLIDLAPEDILAHTSLSILFQRKGMVPEAEAEGNKARILGWKRELREKVKD